MDTFDEIYKKWNPPPKDKLLYQYTSVEGLKNILQYRKLRHTHYKYFNDPREIRYGIRLILDALYTSHIPYLKLAEELFVEFYENTNIYVCCFSEANNMALWRYYALNGSGVCIAYNESFYNTDKEASLEDGYLCKVHYGKNCLPLIESIIKNFRYKAKDAKNLEEFKPHHIELMSNLIAILPMLKDESFSDEHEYRIFYMEGDLMKTPTNKSFFFDDSAREFLTIPKSDLPFISINFNKKPVLTPHQFVHENISQIWIGASCNFLEARAYIRKLLTEYGYDLDKVEIKKSDLPIRI
ncbi:DUF2971 domain-containing protein [Legionella saoudiensis]|uniref:DUF2971 domain-containing protein n=1 Tax=Legionella saoudiensis TaxID=1750561 RepID=UPI000730BF09|nr:DUF2971 domain-containing protein [Legionella saoudiensis]